MKLKTLYFVLGLLPFYILTENAGAFSLSIFSISGLPVPEDVVILLLGAGIVGFIGLGRRKLKK
ncbi:MAG: hypothetical protein PVH42_15265 [Desulfobacterales bacterium]|jgi:hypothetical protein